MPNLTVEIGSRIVLVAPVPPRLAAVCKRDLTIDNPVYVDARKHGRSPRGISRFIKTYTEANGQLLLARGYWRRFKKVANTLGYTLTVVDKTTSFPAQKPPNIIKLRDYQTPWVIDMLGSSQGVGVAAPGAGKTVCGIKMYEMLGQPCLWLTHTKRLAAQTAKRAQDFLGIETGLIGAGKEEVKHFTVGLVPTLIKRDLDEYKDKFGLVILDECFPAGTPVDGKPIETLKVGDLVRSFDEDTGAISKQPITKLFKSKAYQLVRLTLSSGKTIVCTPGHPFWTQAGWRLAADLNCTDKVLSGSLTWQKVESVAVLKPGSDGKFGGLCSDGHVYNIEVEGTHTYLADDIVVHNCHHLPATSFIKVASVFSAKYRYGLTATPYRDDQLEDLMFNVLGPQTALLGREELREGGHLVAPLIVQRPTKFYFPFNSASRKYNFIKLQEALGADVKRNALIVADVVVEATKENNVCIVLVNRIAHGERLYNTLVKLVPKTGLVHSKMSDKKASEVLDSFESGDFTILIATYRMLAEGFDYPPANRLFLTAPYKVRSLIEQACGRVERASPGKVGAIVFDYVDLEVGVLKNQAELRQEIYEASNNKVTRSRPD